MRRLRKNLAIPAILKWFWKTDATICIPAYNASAFIDRTIRCAQGQTYPNVRILISVDHSSDNTNELAERFAAIDRRIEIIKHSDRLGWCANVNALLERADTTFFFIYFHDDVLLPQYCENLRNALLARSDAASANCDLFLFGNNEALTRGRAYDGSIAKRVLTLWGVNNRGAPLRALVRRDKINERYRLPTEERDSLTPQETLLVRMVAAGPSIHVPETLYLRWLRKGGLTDKWKHLTVSQALEGWRSDAARVFSIVDEIIPDSADREILKFAQICHVLRSLRPFYQKIGQALPSFSQIHCDAPRDIDMHLLRKRFGAEIADFLGTIQSNLNGRLPDRTV